METVKGYAAHEKELFEKLFDKLKSFFTGVKYKPFTFAGYPISKRLTRRQDYPMAWIPSGAIYLFKTENLKKGNIYGDKVMLFETPESVNINEKEDWDKAEEYLNKENGIHS